MFKAKEDPDDIANEAINALLKEKEELVRRVKELEEAAQHVAGPGREELAVAEKRVLELEASLEASTEFVAKLKLQNLELVAMCERQQEDHDASAQAAAKAATGPTASSVNVEELKFELEVAQAEIMTLTKRNFVLVDQVKDSSLILDEMEAEMATMSQTISARDATILKHKAYETELEESIAELEALNTLQGGTLEDVKKDFAKKLAQTETEQTNLLTLLDKAQGQSGQSKIQMHAQFQSSADHQEELNHLKKTYEAKLAYKTQETATAEAMLAKVMKDSGKSTNQMDQLVDMKLSAERHWHKSTLVEMEELHAADKARVTKTHEELQKEALKAMQKTYEAKLALKTQEAATAQATLATAMKDSGKSASQVDALVDMKLKAERERHNTSIVEMEALYSGEKARLTKMHETHLEHLTSEYEKKLARKDEEVEDTKKQVEKTRARIIAASGDQAAVMETVINEAEELVEQERAKYEDILLTESAKHKQELEKLSSSFEEQQVKYNNEFARLEKEMAHMSDAHLKAMDKSEKAYLEGRSTLEEEMQMELVQLGEKHLVMLSKVEKSFEAERRKLEDDIELEMTKGQAQVAALQEVTEEEVALERERANMVVEHTKKQLAEYDAHVAAAEKAVRDEVVTELQLLRNELELAQEAARTAAKDATGCEEQPAWLSALKGKLFAREMAPLKTDRIEVDAAQDKFANVGTEMVDARAKLRKENTELRSEHRRELDASRVAHRKELDEVRAALRQEVEQVREERRFDLEETKNELVKEMLTAEDEHAVEMESLKTHVEGQLHALRADHDTAVAAMKQQMAKELAASQSKFSTVSSELIEARAKMRHDGEESRAAHQREMDKTLAEKQATVEKITAALMKEVKDMSEAHTREVLELKANSSQELDTMTEEHIKEKEEVQRENAARLERETGALKRQLAMETGVLTTQLEAMQTAMENELAEERSQIDLTKQKWAAELANLEAETVKTEAERQVCQDAMRKDFEDRDAFIVRIEEELRARTEDNAFYEKQNSELQEKLDDLTSSTAEEIEASATLFETNMIDMDKSYAAQIEEVTRKYEVLLEEYNGNIDAANNALTQLTDLEATREHAQTTQEALMDLQDKFLVVSDAKNNLETKVKEQADALQAWYCRKCYLTVQDS